VKSLPQGTGQNSVGRIVMAVMKSNVQSNTWHLNHIAAPLVVFFVVIGFWEVLVMALQLPTFLLPAPHQIAAAFLANAAMLFQYGFNTFRQAFFGFVIGCGLGILAATIVARFRLLSEVLVPFAVASNSIPIVAMAPLTIVWFGIGEGSKIAIVAIMCFFPTMISTARGLTAVPADALSLMRSYAASELQVFRKLRLPTALPYMFNAFKICSTLSMIGAIVAEFFGGSVKYLGVYIKTEANILHTTEAWAAILVACLIGITFYLSIVAIERLVMPWHSFHR
jgi:NitT/TauT family transport system permease protein